MIFKQLTLLLIVGIFYCPTFVEAVELKEAVIELNKEITELLNRSDTEIDAYDFILNKLNDLMAGINKYQEKLDCTSILDCSKSKIPSDQFEILEQNKIKINAKIEENTTRNKEKINKLISNYQKSDLNLDEYNIAIIDLNTAIARENGRKNRLICYSDIDCPELKTHEDRIKSLKLQKTKILKILRNHRYP